MTNTAKKPAKTSRDTLDLDLDARLDQATSTLYLDEEPVEGDMLDQVLAKAKKELDAASAPKKSKKIKEETESVTEPVALAEENIELGDGFNLDELGDLMDLELENEKPVALQSESLKSLENQLASVLDETPAVSDDEIDELLGGAGYDFDSLLGDANDELTADEAQLNEDSLLAAVDELLNLSMEPEIEAVIEPEIVEIEPKIEAVIEPEIVEIEPEMEAVIEPEITETDISDLDFEFEFEFEFEEESFLEPEIETKEDLIDSYESELPFVEGMFEEKIPQEVELQVEPEVALDDLVDSVPFEDTLKIDDEEKNDILIEEFNDFDDVADIAAPLVEISLPNDDELAQQLDGLNDAMENTNEKPAGFDLIDDEAVEKESVVSTEKVEDESDWLKQLDDLDAQQTSEDENTPAVSFEKEEVAEEEAAEIATTVEDEGTDWMKQLDDLDAVESPIATAEKTADDVAADDDWMSQLDDVNEVEETAETPTEEVAEEAVAAEDDWMSQLEGLDDNESVQDETVSDEDDWMKQLEGMDDSSETAVIDDNFNIADEEPARAAPEIDETAIIAKAAQFAIDQIKEENDGAISALTEKHDVAFSQLRADQDTLETRSRKQFADAENGRKKAATFSYAALGVGVLALLGSGGLGYMTYTAQNDTQTLKQSVSELEETVNGIVSKAPEKEKEIEKIKTSVDQLNQKVDKLVADQRVTTASPATTDTEAAKNGSAVNLLNSKTPAPALTTGKIDTGLDGVKVADAPLAPPVDIAPAHPVADEAKVDTKLTDMAKKSADEAKAKAEKLAAEKAAKAKAQEAAKAEAALLSEKLAKAAAIAKAASASTKTEEQRKLLDENSGSRYKGKMTRGMARGVEKQRAENSKTTQEKQAQVETKTKEILNTAVKPQKAVPAGKYSVNMVSYQQEWFAQSKAAEFKQKGIPVEVVPVNPNSPAPKFRLKVGGFKTKTEADSYAAKVKKSHGIDTWTGTN